MKMTEEIRRPRGRRRAKRPYQKRRRAEQEQRTRQRITESAVELHGSVGPARTSISALARHAGVRRSTVYRHFPDELALFTACTTHWLAANPFPEISRWAEIADAGERLRRGLNELYAHYRRTEPMMTNVLRDELTMPVLGKMLDGYRRYLTAARAVLLEGRQMQPSSRRYVDAAIAHALAFQTWRSLAIEGRLDDATIARLMCLLVAAIITDAELGGR